MVFSPPAFVKEQREAANWSHGELVGRDKRVRDGIEDETELLENAERDGNDCFIRRELHEFSVIAGEDLYAAVLPLNPFNWTGELDAGSSLANFLREEMGEPVVAFADAEEFVSVNLFFGALLDGEGVDAYLAVVGGVEALDIADDLVALFRRKLVERRVVGKSKVRAFPVFEATEELEDFILLVAFPELAIFVTNVQAIEFACVEAGFTYEFPKFGRAAVDELGPEFKNFALLAESADAAAYAVAGFKDEDLTACFGEPTGSGQAGHTGTDDQNALLFELHQKIGCGEGLEVNANWSRTKKREASNPGLRQINRVA
jgi:hypothetical protein